MDSKRHYVYMILRTEDEVVNGAIAPAGSPWYVGLSGDDRRITNSRQRCGRRFEQPHVHKFAEGLTEQEAQDLETCLISQYGRACKEKTGILKNRRAGGYTGRRGKRPPSHGKATSAGMIGKKHTAERVARIADGNSRWWWAKSPNGEMHVIKNMSQFCRDNQLEQGNMRNVAYGKRKHYKGWTCGKLTEAEAMDLLASPEAQAA